MCRNKSIAAFCAASEMFSELILIVEVQRTSCVEPRRMDKNNVSPQSFVAETSIVNAGSMDSSSVSKTRKMRY